MASVYFDPALGGDGSTVTDDNNATTGLGNNGHRTLFVPALSQTVVMAGTATTKAAEAAASASTASTAATTATTKAGEAVASAVAAQSAANSGDSWKYLFSTATTSGPATGTIRFNNASSFYAGTTAIFLNETSNDGLLLSNLINMLDDSTSTNKAKLTVRSTTTPTTYITFNVTAMADNGTYNTITVSRIAGSGVFANTDPVVVSYRLTGDKGDAGTAAASSVSFTPTGAIAATDVQAAIAELDTEKAAATNGTLVNPTITNGYTEETATTRGSSLIYDLANGTIQRLQTTANVTITLPDVAAGKSFQVQVEFGGAHTLSFAGGAVAWSGNTTPTFSGASGKTDVINFVANYAGTKWLGALHGKGYV